MGNIDNSIKTALQGAYLRSDNFIEGLTCTWQGMVVADAENPKFGAQKEMFGLRIGQQWQIAFLLNGEGKVLNTTSVRLVGKLVKLDPDEGDELFIKRIGEGFETDWEVRKVE